MTPIQQRLLELLEELVAICEENDIVYYVAGGTTLGAMRHGGFIPWDDDVDLMMPRSDWEHFVEVARKGLPPGRALACIELDSNYPHVFGRYVDTTSTSIHYNQFLGGTPQGLVVDIFILDPVPDANDAYAAHREVLSLYNDLANSVGYSYPMSSSKEQLQHWAKRIEREGRRAVLEELGAVVSRYDDGEYLVMRWAAAPRLFHKSIFARPRWEMFEGLRVRVPGRCADYLVQHYGDDWMYLPSEKGRVTHDAITFLDVDYRTFQADYLPSINVRRTRQAILARREYHITHMDELHEAEDIEAWACAEFARLVTLDRAEACGVSSEVDFSEAQKGDLDWVFAEFYRWQGSATLAGREAYLQIRRYHEPVYIDIGDGLLNLAVLNLVQTNRVGLAHRVLRVRELAKGVLGSELSEAKDAVDAVRRPASLFDAGRAEEALVRSRELLVKMPENFSNRVFLAELLYRRGEFEELAAVAAEGRRLYPEAGEFVKYAADCAYAHAATDEEKRAACEEYARALTCTTNGFIQKDVAEKTARDAVRHGDCAAETIHEFPVDAVQQVPSSANLCDAVGVGEKTSRLLGELVDICAEHGIGCSLGPESMRLALRYGCNEPGLPVLDLLVAASDLPVLAKVVIERDRKDRALDCWLTNEHHQSFTLDYVDKSTTYLQFDEGSNIVAHGVKVTVIPVRSMISGIKADVLDLVETGWELNGYRFTKRINAKRVCAAALARTGMVPGRGRLARTLMRELAVASDDAPAEAVIRLPGRGLLVFDASCFWQGSPIRFCGREYAIPAGAEEVLTRVFGSSWDNDPIVAKKGKSLVSTTLAYDELLAHLKKRGCDLRRLFSIMSRVRIRMLPLVNDLRMRNQAMMQAELSRDRKKWHDYLSARDSQIAGLVDRGDLDGLGQLFAGYESEAMSYLRQGLCLCPSEVYLATLCVLLRAKGEGGIADKLEGLVEKRHLAPLGSNPMPAGTALASDGVRNADCKVTLLGVRTPGEREMRISVKAKAGDCRIASAQLRSSERSIDSTIDVPCSVEEVDGWLFADIAFNPQDLVFRGTFWDLFILVDCGEGVLFPVRVSTKKSYRVRAQYTNRQCRFSDGMVLFPRFNKDGSLAFTYRKVSTADTMRHKCKEFAALVTYAVLRPYWKNRRIWLVYEKFCSYAQDNAFRFFEYCMNDTNGEGRDFVYYVIDRGSPDYPNVERYGKNVIGFMGFRHMLYAMAADIYVASDSRSHLYQWRPKPNVVRGRIAKHDLFFLQHGVTALKRVDRIYGVHGSSPVTYFLTTTEREQDLVVQNFGYSREKAPVLGFSRWDVLENRSHAESPVILIMPTWRSWLDEQSEDVFLVSRFYRAYSSLLANPALQNILAREGAVVRFYIHPKIRAFLSCFARDIPNVELIAAGERPLNELIMECSMLLTDYSSACWDVLLLGKPVVFYQFDREEYLDDVGSYVDLETELPGMSCVNESECVSAIGFYAERGFRMTDQDVERASSFIPRNDRENRKRTYRFLVSEGF